MALRRQRFENGPQLRWAELGRSTAAGSHGRQAKLLFHPLELLTEADLTNSSFGLSNGADRANNNTCAAAITQIGIDDIHAGAFGNDLHRAFRLTRAAADTIRGYLKRHTPSRSPTPECPIHIFGGTKRQPQLSAAREPGFAVGGAPHRDRRGVPRRAAQRPLAAFGARRRTTALSHASERSTAVLASSAVTAPMRLAIE